MTAPHTKEAPAGQGEGFEIHNAHEEIEEIEDSMTQTTVTCTEAACVNHGEQHAMFLLPMHEYAHCAMDVQGDHWTVEVTMAVDDDGPGPWQVSYTFDMQQAERLDEDELRRFMEVARTARTLETLLNATVPENALLTRGLTSNDVREFRTAPEGAR